MIFHLFSVAAMTCPPPSPILLIPPSAHAPILPMFIQGRVTPVSPGRGSCEAADLDEDNDDNKEEERETQQQQQHNDNNDDAVIAADR